MKYLPLAVINIARRIHGWKARGPPNSRTGYTRSGLVSHEKMVEDHPLELEEMKK